MYSYERDEGLQIGTDRQFYCNLVWRREHPQNPIIKQYIIMQKSITLTALSGF